MHLLPTVTTDNFTKVVLDKYEGTNYKRKFLPIELLTPSDNGETNMNITKNVLIYMDTTDIMSGCPRDEKISHIVIGKFSLVWFLDSFCQTWNQTNSSVWAMCPNLEQNQQFWFSEGLVQVQASLNCELNFLEMNIKLFVQARYGKQAGLHIPTWWHF
ncbi:hypothetical protein BJV74DRAFT_799822 [Russula compacta]|nr:hypothetical protein BJV74DRAFT_799822 [Russula compacta]